MSKPLSHADSVIGPGSIEFLHLNSYVVIKDILTPDEVEQYCILFDRFFSGAIDIGRNRSDLRGHVSRKQSDVENMTQIVWPSDFVRDLADQPYHRRALSVARQFIGNDADFDSEMLIEKAPNKLFPTPWHQDTAYWVKLNDRRAASSWLARTMPSSRMTACGTSRVSIGWKSRLTGTRGREEAHSIANAAKMTVSRCP